MKLAFAIALIAASGVIGGVAVTQRKPVGSCMPYAEKCLHCTDCSQCKHCTKDKGKCSVCWDTQLSL